MTRASRALCWSVAALGSLLAAPAMGAIISLSPSVATGAPGGPTTPASLALTFAGDGTTAGFEVEVAFDADRVQATAAGAGGATCAADNSSGLVTVLYLEPTLAPIAAGPLTFCNISFTVEADAPNGSVPLDVRNALYSDGIGSPAPGPHSELDGSINIGGGGPATITVSYAPPAGGTVAFPAGTAGTNGDASITVTASAGTGTATVNSCAVSGAGAGSFSILSGTVSLTASQSDTLDLRCARTAAATTATLTCVENDSDSSSVNRTWNLSCPAGSVSNNVTLAYVPPAGTTITFASGSTGGVATSNIQVNATGSAGTGTINTCALSGAGSGAFAITNGNVSLSGGQSGNLGLSCTRQATQQTATVTCVENDSDSTNTNRAWPLVCPAGSATNDVTVAYAPPVGTTIAFPAGPTGGTATTSIQATASGTSGTATINGCAVTGSGSASFAVTSPSLSLTPGQNGPIGLSCARQAVQQSATLTCVENDSDSTNTNRAWPLVCPAGTAANNVTLATNPLPGTLIPLSAGPQGAVATASITATASGTTGTGSLAGCAFSGAGASAFTVNPTSLTLSGGQTDTFSLSCTRTAADRSATLTCQETDADSTAVARAWPVLCPAGGAAANVVVNFNPTPGSTITFAGGAPGGTSTVGIAVNATGTSGTATVNSCALAGPGASAFAITTGPLTLLAGQSGSIGLSCTRDGLAAQQASLTCLENDSNSTNATRTWPLVCPLGVEPVTTMISYIPPPGSVINFPGGTVGTSDQANITVSAGPGNGQARVENCSVSGGSGAFAVLNGNALVNPESSTDLTFQCTRAEVARTGTLTCQETDVDSTAAQRSWTLNCPSGAAINDAIADYTPPAGSVVAFPVGALGDKVAAGIEVRALGTGGNIQLGSCDVTGPNAGNFLPITPNSISLAAGQTGVLPLTCQVLSSPQQATLSCLENDSDSANTPRTWTLDCPAGVPSNVVANYTPEPGSTIAFASGPSNSSVAASIQVNSIGTVGRVRVNNCGIQGPSIPVGGFTFVQNSVDLGPGEVGSLDLLCARGTTAFQGILTCRETDSNSLAESVSWNLSCPAGVAPNDVLVAYAPPPGSVLNFPGGMVGNVANRTIEVSTTGTAGTAKIENCAIEGSGAAGFKVNPSSLTLEFGQSGQLGVTCTSIAAPQEATLTCNETDSNSAAIPVSWALSCAAGQIPPDVTTTYTPAAGQAIRFPAGPQNTNALAAIQVATAGTTGSSRISQCEIRGASPSAFRVVSGTLQLGPADSGLIDLRCLRGATEQQGELACVENDSDSTNEARIWPLICPAGSSINTTRITYEPVPGSTVIPHSNLVPSPVGPVGSRARLPITVRASGSVGEASVDNCVLGGTDVLNFTLESPSVRLMAGQQADLAASCTLTDAVQTATLSCLENDGDSQASPRNWNLSCPAGTSGNNAVLTFDPPSGEVVEFPLGPNGMAAYASIDVGVDGTLGLGVVEECQISGPNANYFTLETRELLLNPGMQGSLDMSCARSTEDRSARLSCRATDSSRAGEEVSWDLDCPAATPIAPILVAEPMPEDASPLTCDGLAGERVTRTIYIGNAGSPGPQSDLRVACAATGQGFAITPFAPQRLASGAVFPFTLTCTVPNTGTRTGKVVCSSNSAINNPLTYDIASSVRLKPKLNFNPNGGPIVLQPNPSRLTGSISKASTIRVTTQGGQGGAPAAYSCAVPEFFQVTNAANDDVVPGSILPDLSVTCLQGPQARAATMRCDVEDQSGARRVDFALSCPAGDPNQVLPQVVLVPRGGTIDLPAGESVTGASSGLFPIQVNLVGGMGTVSSTLACQGEAGLLLTNNVQTRLTAGAVAAPVFVGCTLGAQEKTLGLSCVTNDSLGERTHNFQVKCPAGNASVNAPPLLEFNPPTGETLEPPRGSGATSGTTLISVTSSGGNGTGRAALDCDITRGFALTGGDQTDLERNEDPADLGLSCAPEDGVFSGELTCAVTDALPRTVRYNLLCPSRTASPGNGAGAKWVSDVASNQPIECLGAPGSTGSQQVRVSNFGLSGSVLALSCVTSGPGFQVNPFTANLQAGQSTYLTVACQVPAQGVALGELRCTSSDSTQATVVHALRATPQAGTTADPNMIPVLDLRGLFVLVLLCLGIGGWVMRRQ